MATLTITIELDNAAFADDEAGEVATILRAMARRVELVGDLLSLTDCYPMRISDTNGNTVGTAVRTA